MSVALLTKGMIQDNDLNISITLDNPTLVKLNPIQVKIDVE